jgi:putative endonuclease
VFLWLEFFMAIESLNLWHFGEEEGARFLKKNGCKITERNYRTSRGEIDIIARSGNIIIFVEVRTRASNTFAEPWETVGHRKRERIRAAAREYLREKPSPDAEVRFDILSITLDDGVKPRIDWLQNAF